MSKQQNSRQSDMAKALHLCVQVSRLMDRSRSQFLPAASRNHSNDGSISDRERTSTTCTDASKEQLQTSTSAPANFPVSFLSYYSIGQELPCLCRMSQR